VKQDLILGTVRAGRGMVQNSRRGSPFVPLAPARFRSQEVNIMMGAHKCTRCGHDVERQQVEAIEDQTFREYVRDLFEECEDDEMDWVIEHSPTLKARIMSASTSDSDKSGGA